MIVVTVEVHEGHLDEFIPKILANAHGARTTEPGCLAFDVVQDTSDPHKFVFYEVYESEAAFAEHHKTAHFLEFVRTAGLHMKAKERRNFVSLN